MELREKNGVSYCVFPELEATGIIIHAFTTRKGGISRGVYATLNLGYHVGDDPAAVAVNRSRALEAIGVPGGRRPLERGKDVMYEGGAGAPSASGLEFPEGQGDDRELSPPAGSSPLVAVEQVHGDRVVLVTSADRGKEWAPHASAVARADGLITRARGLVLSAYFADCVPIFLVDPVEAAIGLLHAGWRGTALCIAAKGVAAMRNSFGTDPRNLLAAIGPSIGPCCYEVDQDVAARVGSSFATIESRAERGENKYRLNLWDANRRQLLDAGIPSRNILVASICTSCNQELFFSHRGSGGLTGRMAALISLC